LAEMVRDGKTGMVAAAADPAALAAALARRAADPAAARQMGEAARAATLADRSWSQVAASMATAHPGLSAAASAATNAAPPAPADIPPLNLPAGITSLDDAQKAELDRRLIEAATQGAPALRGLLERQNAALPARLAAFSTLRAAQAALDAGLQDDALALGTEALARDGAPGTLRALARLHANAADFNQAAALARRLEAALPSVGDADRRFIDEQVEREALERETAQRQAAAFEPVVGRALNLLAFSLPYTSVGYATRSHGLALGIQHAGWDIRPFTRPGFPQDFKPELQGQALPDSDCIDGITYGRLFAAARVGSSEVEYMRSSAAHYERLIRELRPQVVHAASNYVTALPALVAARRCGVPFIYEVRGFWEVTRSSRDAGFERTPKFRHMERFERVVALNADRVITITTAMRDELVARGVAADRIDIAFNSVDPARFSPRPRDEALAQRLGLPAGVPVIGYVGSFVDYEGLDDLVTAAAGLRDQGADFRMLLVGDGAVFQSLIDQVQALGLDDLVTLTGRVPHDEVEAYYSLIDVAPFPRKPWEVCELVSPLKPFEAMALHKPVVVSSTRALLEIVEDGVNGLLFDKGSPASLQEALHRLVTDASLRAALGERARGWIERERSWDRAGQVVVGAYDHTIGGAGVRC
ncbi:MAG: glycosyltransferase, partial [Rhodoferax sp.]|nr:glycosyltransferase [Rhodoferax sp.]